jgi:ubiquinone/menaquinone biosynthesis C-methylase UbiE
VDHYNSRKVAEDYHRAFTQYDGNPELKKKVVQRYDKFTSRLTPGGRILDAGCGTGRFVKYFLRDGFKVTGIDRSGSMIDIAAKNNSMAEFMVMDICHLEFPSNYFDGIWNVATLLHLDEADVKFALKESMRVLKSDGTLYIATRTKDTGVSIIEESTEGGEMRVNYYSATRLNELLRDSGFETVENSVEPDDYLRPFDYAFILAEPST